MSGPKLEFFFDYASPYAYFGSLRVEEVAARQGAVLAWRPFVLGGVFQATGIESPITNPAKGKHLLEDLENLAAFFDAPYKPRTDFIIRSILPLRATLQIPDGPERARAVHALYHQAWGEDADMADPELVASALNDSGFDGRALVEGTQRQEIKDELKRNTDEAIGRGVFGAPTFFIEGEKMFWGHDRLNVVEHFLQRSKAS